MNELGQIYKCSVCGNIVELVYAGGGELVCCGEAMHLMQEKKEDTGQEKHLPVVEREGGRVTVKVGSIPHPMEEDHYIEWIQVLAGGKAYREFLKPGSRPEAVFELASEGIAAREYCSVHGLWKDGNGT